MTKQSEELRSIVKNAKELDAKTSAGVLVVIADIMEGFEETITEFQRTARETNVNVQKSFIDIRQDVQNLEKGIMDYRADREKSELEEKTIAYSIAKRRANNLSTQEKIEVKHEINEAMSKDKIDIRGIKFSSSQFVYVLIGAIILSLAVIVFLPDAVSQILIRLGGLIGGVP